MSALTAEIAIISGLRRAGDEPQLTQVLASVFRADPGMGAQFVRIVLRTVTGDASVATPASFLCTTEEVVDDGRLDLRFRNDGWDVIVELKIHAGYGRNQLTRYLAVLDDVHSAFLAAVTRSVPRYGEPATDGDVRWLGSVQWRRLLPHMRAMKSVDQKLNDQWPILLDVLEAEGSMGFTKPRPDLFEALGQVRASGNHIAEFVRAVQVPLHAALVDALGGDDTAAAIYRTRGGGLYVGKSWNGIIETAFRIPPSGPPAIRSGVFGFNPPVRFFVAPHQGRRWAARLARLDPKAQAAVRFLFERGFRDHDLHAFYDLDRRALQSPTLEEDVVEWAHARFVDIVQSGLLDTTLQPGGPTDELGDAE